MTKAFEDILDQIFDLRDVIERFEELENELNDIESREENAAELAEWHNDYDDEYLHMQKFLNEVKGYGGDEQWRGDWYPITFIRNDYTAEYTEELIKDCCDLPKEIPHYIAIDWAKTWENIRVDYSQVEIGADTYWYR